MASAVVIGAAVWIYCLKESTRNMTYAPTVLIGCGMSAMTVVALVFVNDAIGNDKVCVTS